ncbi:hypothetical protein GOV12_07035, partial [Candidatus Pacearchaeota archaeon]|nr:hypothetical protein [Candidatus Pacearchaeota archaeon]
MNKFNIYIEQNRIFSNSKLAIALEQKSKFGEKKSGLIIYSPYEALYLYEKNKAELIKNNKKITNQNIIKNLSKDKNFY